MMSHRWVAGSRMRWDERWSQEPPELMELVYGQRVPLRWVSHQVLQQEWFNEHDDSYHWIDVPIHHNEVPMSQPDPNQVPSDKLAKLFMKTADIQPDEGDDSLTEQKPKSEKTDEAMRDSIEKED